MIPRVGRDGLPRRGSARRGLAPAGFAAALAVAASVLPDPARAQAADGAFGTWVRNGTEAVPAEGGAGTALGTSTEPGARAGRHAAKPVKPGSKVGSNAEAKPKAKLARHGAPEPASRPASPAPREPAHLEAAPVEAAPLEPVHLEPAHLGPASVTTASLEPAPAAQTAPAETIDAVADGTEVVAPLPPSRPFIKGRFVDLGLSAVARRGRRTAKEPVLASIGEGDAEAAPSHTPTFVRAGGTLAGLIDQHAQAHGLPTSLAHAVVKVESRYNPRAAHAGNYGLMQIRLATARSMGYAGGAEGLLDPETNVTFGMKYLAAAHKLSGGSFCGTAAKYQGGLRSSGNSAGGRAYCAKLRANGGGA